MRTMVTFDGTRLTDWVVVSGLQRPLLPRRPEYVNVPGADGAIFAGVVDDTRTVKLTMTLIDHDRTARMQAARRLAATLDVDSPRPLAISEDGGLYYMAMPTAGADGIRFLNAESFDVEFTCDAFMYGETHTFALSVESSGSQRILVDGTKPAPMRMDATVTGSGTWRLEADWVDAYTATVSGSAALSIDAERRVATRDGATYALPPTNEWLWLEPGEHAIRSYGASVSGTLTYTERWA